MNIGLAYPVTYGLYAKFQAAPDNWQNYHVAEVNGVANMIQMDALSAPGLLESAVWKLVPGLADPNCYSIESKHYPGHYIHHKNFRIYVAANDGTPTFNQDATFMIRPQHAPGEIRFESFSWPGYFLRHWAWELWIANGKGAGAQSATDFTDASTFILGSVVDYNFFNN